MGSDGERELGFGIVEEEVVGFPGVGGFEPPKAPLVINDPAILPKPLIILELIAALSAAA
mgnify:CR=1 FL=1